MNNNLLPSQAAIASQRLNILFAPEIDLTAKADKHIHLFVYQPIATASLDADAESRRWPDDGVGDDGRGLHLRHVQP